MKNFRTSVALGTSLFLTLVFFWVTPSIWVCVIYGLIGGISVNSMINWWQDDEKSEAVNESELIPFSKDLNKMLVKTKIVKPENTKAKHSTEPSSIIEWFLKADKSPPTK